MTQQYNCEVVVLRSSILLRPCIVGTVQRHLDGEEKNLSTCREQGDIVGGASYAYPH